jgi:2-methylcitrate dehydratase PrpD
MIRMARSGNPQFARTGFHATAITAPFGAAATVAQLLEFDRDTTENALCLAALGGSGVMAAFKQGSTQPLQVAWGVGNGVTAALLAGKGHAGYPRIIEEGFFPAYLGTDGSDSVIKNLEHEYAISGCYLKPYPGCRHMHASLYAFDDLATGNSFAADEIEAISVGTYRVAIDTGIATLNRRGDAYFNIPYAIAARAVLGKSGYDAFDETNFSNNAIVALMNKITVAVHPEIEALYPGKRGSSIEVKLASGQVLTKTVHYPLGEPENPVSLAVTREKLFDAAGDCLSATDKERVAETILTPAGSASLHDVAELLLKTVVF